MRLISKLRYCFGSMIMFNGRLTCSPNTLNNEVHTYMYAYDWQKQYTTCLLNKRDATQYSYEKWIDLINKVAQFNRFSVQCYKECSQKFPQYRNINIMDFRAFRLFHDWDIWGDSTSYAQIIATAYYDENKDNPIEKIQCKEGQKPLYLTSKLGMHKGIMANLDTDSQDMTKYYGFSMIMDQKIKFMPDPFPCRDLHFRTVDMLPWTSSMGVDWFASGKVQPLYPGATEVNYPLNQIYKSGQDNWLSLRMMQYRYNHPTKVSGVVGHIDSVQLPALLGNTASPQPNNYWRIVQVSGSYCNPNPAYQYNTQHNNKTTVEVYFKEVKYGKTKQKKGVLFDISSAILDANTTDLLPILPSKFKVKIETILGSKPIEKQFTNDQIKDLFLTKAGIWLLPLDQGQSLLPRTPLKIEIDMEVQSYQVYNNQQKQASVMVQVTLSGEQKKATLQIKDRVLKTQRSDFRINDGKTRLNAGEQPRFQDFITLDLNLTSFGQKVDSGNSTIQINLSSSFNIDTSGLTQYTTDPGYLSELKMPNIKDRINNLLTNSQTFKKQYTDIDQVNRLVYDGRLQDIIQKTNRYLKRVYTPSTPGDKPHVPTLEWKWRNNKQSQCLQEKVYLTFKDLKGNFTNKLQVQFRNGKASVNVYLNRPLTDLNNPRYPFLESLCLVGSLTTSLNDTDLKKTFTAIFFQNTAEPLLRSPFDYVDWINVVGPKLKLMGLLYPSMQKIVNLYSYDGMSMSAMKRAFEVQNQNHSRYMPATREMSSITHRQIRQWLYSPTYDAQIQQIHHFPLIKTQKKFQYSTDQITAAIFSMNDKSNRYNRLQKKPRQAKYGNSTMDFFYLQNLVNSAFKIEMTTIPLYLSALYSLKQPNSIPGNLIRGVAKDQMKHLFIVSNLSNAIGLTPPYPKTEHSVSHIPTYPANPPLCFNFQLAKNKKWKELMRNIPLQTCGQEQLLRFVIIEMPSQCYEINVQFRLNKQKNQCNKKHPVTGRTLVEERQYRLGRLKEVMAAITEQFANNKSQERNQFLTIGMAYEQIMELLWKLNDADSNQLFNGDSRKQFTYMYLQNMAPIINLRTALEQIRLITEEGEGSNIFTLTGEINKQSHFIKFLEIYLGSDVKIENTYKFSDKTGDICPLQYKREATFIFTPNNQKYKYFPDYSQHVWTEKKDKQVDELVKQEMSVTRFSDDLTQTKFPNTYAPSSFLNTYKKILYDLYYIFTSDPDDTQFKDFNNFNQRRLQKMENAIARMRQMTMNADHVVNPNDTYNNTSHTYDSATPKFNFENTYDPLQKKKKNDTK